MAFSVRPSSIKVKEEYRGKRVLIFGLGQYPAGSGAAAARFFARRGAKVTVTDKKSRRELAGALKRLGAIKARFALGGHRMAEIRRSDLIIRNPAVPLDSPYLREARRLGLPVLSDTVIFFRRSKTPIIGVTGTRGKSTTSALIARMLALDGRRVYLGGNIKVSPLTFLDRLRAGDIVVLELSSWMLESLAEEGRSPETSVITNLMPDHLNTYKSMKDYAAAKEAIFRFQAPSDRAVLSRDNPWTRRMGARVPSRRIWTSLGVVREENAVFVRQGKITIREEGREIEVAPTSALGLRGRHNIENALSAAAAARSVGVSLRAIRGALRSFRGLPDRLELVRVLGGVRYINDTTATTPEAVIAALKTVGPRGGIILIAGGSDKKLVFKALSPAIKKSVRAVVLLPGSATTKLERELRKGRTAPTIRWAGNMASAVRLSSELARSGDHVLLSPGAASFGLFLNEFDRGEQFRREVKRLRSQLVRQSV